MELDTQILPVKSTTPTESGLTGVKSYSRVCQLAAGGMGRVDLVLREEGAFRRFYAVKRLHPHLQDDREFRDMFVEEARIAGLLQHPNIVSVLDVGEDEDGLYLVMDFIDGISLSELLKLTREANTPVPIQIAVRIAIEVARGLHAAHELIDHQGHPLGLVHRDLSPQNVMVSFSGAVRITDFGIAKASGRDVRTSTGILKGKVGYMAPEQLRFEEADRRADLFALGVVLFEVMSGSRLYQNRDGMDGVRRILNDGPPDLGELRPDAPPALVALLFELLAKNPADRPATAFEVGETLDALLRDVLNDETPLTVPDFVGYMAAETREERRKEIANALLGANGSSAVKKLSPMRVGTVQTALRRLKAWHLMTVALLALALGLGLGGHFFVVSPTEASPTETSAPAASSESLAPALAASAARGALPPIAEPRPQPAPEAQTDTSEATLPLQHEPQEPQERQDANATPQGGPAREPEAQQDEAQTPVRARSMRRRRSRPRRPAETHPAGMMWYQW